MLSSLLAAVGLRQPSAVGPPSPLLNVGCGRRFHPDWTNADLTPAAPGILAIDLRRPLPFGDAAFDAAYCSHVLEHLTPLAAHALVAELRRVVRPGGVVRVVVPDLEGIARAYVASLDSALADRTEAAAWRHRWMTVELLDQLVREESGGAMRRWWCCDPPPCRGFIEERLGEEAREAIDALAAARDRGELQAIEPSAILRAAPVDEHAASAFAAGGERHRWMYDRLSLAQLLADAGLPAARRVAADESAIPGFARYGLDADAAGKPHKPDSLFMEAARGG